MRKSSTDLLLVKSKRPSMSSKKALRRSTQACLGQSLKRSHTLKAVMNMPVRNPVDRAALKDGHKCIRP
ncbi:hypothetical protein AOLI_G00261310 [Acnodon oligacanthus]